MTTNDDSYSGPNRMGSAAGTEIRIITNDSSSYFGCVYKEYTAMAARIDAYSNGTFDDFKLFAALGALLAWKPIAGTINCKESSCIDNLEGSCLVLFFGFLTIAVIVAILEARSLLRLSLIRYYMERLRDIENELIKLSPNQSTKVFNIAHCWGNWYEKKHRPIGWLYYILLYGTIITLPTIIFAFSYKSSCLAYIYVGFAAAIYFTLGYATWALKRK